mgnify:CR=1 FL=1
MINKYYTFSLNDNSNNFIKNSNRNKYKEFPNCIFHKNFEFYKKEENFAIMELTINKLKESKESLSLFYLNLKKFYENYWKEPDKKKEIKEISAEFSLDEKDFEKLKLYSCRNLFNMNRFRLRRNIMQLLNIDNSFDNCETMIYFIDNLIFTFNDYDFISKLILDFLKYLENMYSLELDMIYKDRKIDKKRLINI